MTPIETAVGVVVGLITRGEYDVVESLTRGRRLSAGSLREAVETYGRSLVPPPEGWTQVVDVVPVETTPGTYFVAAPLWTAEEGRSDLTLELHLSEIAPGVYDTEVLDLHVL